MYNNNIIVTVWPSEAPGESPGESPEESCTKVTKHVYPLSFRMIVNSQYSGTCKVAKGHYKIIITIVTSTFS